MLWGVALLVATTASVAQERPAFAPVSDAGRAIEINSQPASYELANGDGSTELRVSASCSHQRPTRSDIVLGWDLPGAAAAEIRVDVTGYSEGFATGRYVTSGARSAARRSLTFLDGEPGVNYYWRLLTRTAEGWTVRANGRFEAPTCPNDSFTTEEEEG
jgi:hypothetical protein